MDIHTHKILAAVQALSKAASNLLTEEQQLQARELSRMSTLLHEAVTELANCFSIMSDQLVAQSAQLRSAKNVNEDGGNRQEMNALMMSTQQMNTCVTRAVVALQFEDILQQMIRHSRQRIEETEKLLGSIHARVENLESGGVDLDTIMKMLDACQKEIAATREALAPDHPVQQQTMQKGDVTLF